MAINLVQKPQGSGILSAIGTVLGVAAAPFTGGASLATIAAGAGLGKTIGTLGDAALNKQNQPKGVGEFNVVEGKPQMGVADVIGKVGDVIGAANTLNQGAEKVGDMFSESGPTGKDLLTVKNTDDAMQERIKRLGMGLAPKQLGGRASAIGRRAGLIQGIS